MRLYRYIGPSDIGARAGIHSTGTRVTTPAHLAKWIVATHQLADAEGRIVATFVVTAEGILLLADRAPEVNRCAVRGKWHSPTWAMPGVSRRFPISQQATARSRKAGRR